MEDLHLAEVLAADEDSWVRDSPGYRSRLTAAAEAVMSKEADSIWLAALHFEVGFQELHYGVSAIWRIGGPVATAARLGNTAARQFGGAELRRCDMIGKAA